MRKFLGSYGPFESLISIVFFALFLLFNFFFLEEVINEKTFNEKAKFMSVFINIMLLVIIALPLISRLLGKIPDSKLKEFIELPEKDDKFKFSSISNFLSDQALASFLVTILTFTGIETLDIYGGSVTAGYVFLLFLIAVILAVVSLVRFIFHFTKYHWLFYALASTLSTFVMFAFLNLGLKFGT